VEDIENHLRETRQRWLGHLERMDETNLVKRVRKDKVPGHMKRGRPKNLWDERVRKEKVPGHTKSEAGQLDATNLTPDSLASLSLQ